MKKEKYNENIEKILKETSEAINLELGITPYDEQLLAAKQLLKGNILEMYTGEGKSVVNVLAAITAIKLEDNDINHVHIFTSNEYLATRDYEEFIPVFEKLGLSLGLVLNDDSLETKQENYSKNVIYTASHNTGFDYLRQNLNEELLTFSNELYNNTFAIVDEVDSILLDKGNTPLILSENEDHSKDIFIIDKIVSKLTEDKHYYKEKKLVILTDEGIKLIENRLMLSDNLFSKNHSNILKRVYNALNAHYKMVKNVDYIVKDNGIITIDQMTGRKLESQKYSEGLHQAIEVKEGIEPTPLSVNNGMTTIQSHFKLYKDFGGLTGTSYLARKEFKEIFNKKVVVIPRRKDLLREDFTFAFLTKDESYNKMLELVKSYKVLENPILIGCQSIMESEYVATLLNKNNIKFNLLNAKSDEEEAAIVKEAGTKGKVTIATNMAGRGTDIKLEDSKLGLIVIGLGVSISPRIDEQLRGRSGRQGDPGKSYLLVSYEDDFIINNVAVESREKTVATIAKLAKADGSYFNSNLTFMQAKKFQKSYDDGQSDLRRESSYFDALLGMQRIDFYNLKKESISKFEDGTLERFQESVRLNNLFKTHLAYFNDLKKTVKLASYNGLDPKLEFQLLLDEHYKKIKKEI